MKLSEKNYNVQRTGIVEKKAFTIAVTGKAFEILADKIYKDSILASIRELSTNAYDSHVERGCADKQFLVHLPNQLEPYFSIRDYGVSMSHEKVLTLYSTVFQSDKTGSDDYAGCWGVGRLSAAAYTDSFNLTTFLNKKKRFYCCVKNEAGIPEINYLGEMDTDEEDGLEVKFAVQQKDFYSFQHKAASLFRWFKVRPDVVGVKNFSIPEMKCTLAGKGWELYEGFGNNIAIMGNIAYPVQRAFPYKRYGWVLHFNIGELDVTLGRDNLDMTEKTTQAIVAKLEEIKVELVATISQQISSAKSRYDAARAVDNFRNYGECLRHVKYQGQALPNLVLSQNHYLKGFHYSYRGIVRQKAYININSISKPEIFIDDLKRGGYTRCRERCRATHRVTLYVPDERSAEVISALGLGPHNYSFTSSLPPLSYAKRNHTNIRDFHSLSLSDLSYNSEAIDINDGVRRFYIRTHRNRKCICNTFIENRELTQLFRTLNEFVTTKPHRVYFANSTLSKTLAKSSHWIEFSAYIESAVQVHLSKKTFTEHSGLQYNVLFYKRLSLLATIQAKDFNDLLDQVLVYKAEDISAYTSLARVFGVKLKFHPKDNLAKLEAKILAKYFFLRHYRYSYSELSECSTLINLVDKAN